MAQFPFTERGTVTSYPFEPRESFSSQDVTFNDFSTQVYSRRAQPLGRWELDFNPIDDADYETIRQFVIGRQGRGGQFTFVDPADNLLTQTEEFENVVWGKGSGLVVGKNYLERAEEFDNAKWVKGSTGGNPVPTVTPDVSSPVAPDNTQTADQINFPAVGASGVSRIYQAGNSVPSVGDQTFVGTIFLRASASISISVNLRDQAFNNIGGTSASLNNTTWQRIEVTGTAGGGDTAVQMVIQNTALEAAKTVFAWGAQIEYGSVASDYTKTVATTTELLIADPFWTANPLDSDHPSALPKRGRQIVNTDTSVIRALSHTLTYDVAGGFFTNSLYLKSQSGTSTGTLELSSNRNAISTQSESFTTSYSVGTSSWSRITVSPRFSKGNFDDEVFYALNVPSLSTIHVFGAQLELEGSPSQYKRNTYHSGLHTLCRFADNSFLKDMRSQNNSRLSLVIEEEL